MYKGTTDAIFVIRQLHEKFIANSKVYFGFMDLENAYDTSSKGRNMLGYT